MVKPARVLITGANGYVGQALCHEMAARGFQTRAATRQACALGSGIANVVVGAVHGETNWDSALQGVDVVIHLAARAHILRDSATDALQEFRRTNTLGTERLAHQAALQGVKRLVYVSSIGVNGVSTTGKPRFSELDTPHPHNAYALSKWEAEQLLWQVQQETGLEVVVIRPPLVYGPNAPGNFAEMVKALRNGTPLPLASVNNQRDLIYLGNLIDALIVCAVHPAAVGQTYLVSDGECISTPELLRQLAREMHVPGRVFPFPVSILKLASKLLGKSGQIERLLGSLVVDSDKIRRELNWTPPYTLQQGLQATAEWYRNDRI